MTEGAPGISFITIASFFTKATCFVVIGLDAFLHVRSIPRSVDSEILNY